ncbi:MAG: Gfo/Idh/MocA family oxidoreductase, partial [Ignavibacteriae bacterium]|nr:Gfo/Idh/MocA family oxidoreductase [Ignavibacteriota bacterium]
KEAFELVNIAKEKELKLMVGHVLLYHPAVLTMKEKIDEGAIGKLQYIYSNRLNLGTIRSEENILWSFAPHDISIIQFLTGSKPEWIGAKGAAFVQENIEDTTLTYLKYPNNVHAHIFVSWLHPFKEHRVVVIGDEGMLVFEDSLKNEKLKYYKKGFSLVNGSLEKFDSDYEVINYPEKAPLEEEQKHFFDCVLNNKTPRTDGVHAKEVLEVLETAQIRLNDE